VKYYDSAIYTLETAVSGHASPLPHPKVVAGFALALTNPREGSSISSDPNKLALGRLRRYEERRRAAFLAFSGTQPDARFRSTPDFLLRISSDNLGGGPGSLPFFVLAAHTEAHLAMHGVEAWRSFSLLDHSRLSASDHKWLDQELDRCIALNTFAYSIGRAAPWLFAEDRQESKFVFNNFNEAWQNVVPTRCMWIAAQLTLLALHRRAYAYALRNDREAAYNDYHKLQRLIRDSERRVRRAPVHVEGALEFLAGLAAQADHHTGELYRAEHAHTSALAHFRAADHRLQLLRSKGYMGRVLENSRWHVALQVSRGKACYELGLHKDSLRWHLTAWREFLRLLAADTGTEASTDAITETLTWLEGVQYDPEFRKNDIREKVGPVVDQLAGLIIDRRLGALAAEILVRLGHLLLILNVDSQPDNHLRIAFDDAHPRTRHEGLPQENDLAMRCLTKAAQCDNRSTLIGTNLLKIRYRHLAGLADPPHPALVSRTSDGSRSKHKAVGRDGARADAIDLLRSAPLATVDSQWPLGGDNYERLARVTEYVLLLTMVERAAARPRLRQAANEEIGERLLMNFFTHTDSINVRKLQAHQFLTRPRRRSQPPTRRPAQAIELVCMRRYSSPFLLLPRPSAFRALGGGYFVALHPARDVDADVLDCQPFGIVVDPGVDFVENLYRAGRSLSDVDMVIVTHDHVDHLGALDSLLSLLHARADILADEAMERNSRRPAVRPRPKRPFPVLVNRSVMDRYRSVKTLSGKKSGNSFLPLDDFVRGSSVSGMPERFEIVAMSSEAVDRNGIGHTDLGQNPSFGVCIRSTKKRGPSVAFTSDVPAPPANTANQARWLKYWRPALSADVLVAHLSTTPLTQLRKMARLDASDHKLARKNAKELNRIRANLSKHDPPLDGRIAFAFWLRSRRSGPTASLSQKVPGNWEPPANHAYVEGLLTWARAYKKARGGAGLFIVGELSEELGTMRGKIAAGLNRTVFRKRGIYALTGDIGLRTFSMGSSPTAKGSKHASRSDDGARETRVLCTTCNLDTDRVAHERYHLSDDIHEVCVKGENEGMFYNCLEHEPSLQEEPAFLERLERFDVFGR
jgi:hypothetical protein